MFLGLIIRHQVDLHLILNQTPLMYPTQLYPARIPWTPSVGRLCGNGECGAAGTCVDGVCQRKNSDGTVFNIPV